MASREARTGAPEAEAAAVLVVDDEPDVASVTAAYLERHLEDVAVVVESGGAAAIDRLDPVIDCVVSDYEMPETDGLEFLRRVRERDPDLPFILFTARGSEEIASEAITAGVTDYLQKGVGTDQYQVLANRIQNALARRQSEAAAAETEARYQRLLESSPHAVAVHDGDGLVFANDRLVEIVGAGSVAAVQSVDPMTLIHPEDRTFIRERLGNVIEGQQLEEWSEWRLLRLDGEVRHVESRAAPVEFDGEPASQVVLRDVTERHERECQIRALHEATRRLMTAETLGEVAEITLDIVRDVFDEAVACVLTFDPATDELVPIGLSESADRLAREDDLDPGALTLPEWTVEMTVFKAGEQRVIRNYADREDGATDALETILMHPIDGHGLLTIGSVDPERRFDSSERDLVGILARSVSAAIDRVGADME